MEGPSEKRARENKFIDDEADVETVYGHHVEQVAMEDSDSDLEEDGPDLDDYFSDWIMTDQQKVEECEDYIRRIRNKQAGSWGNKRF